MSRYSYDPLNVTPQRIGPVEYFPEAVACLAGRTTIGPAVIQRALRCGYNHARELLGIMELQGLVGPEDRNASRNVIPKCST